MTHSVGAAGTHPASVAAQAVVRTLRAVGAGRHIATQSAWDELVARGRLVHIATML